MEDVDAFAERVYEAAGVIARSQSRRKEDVLKRINVSTQYGSASITEMGGEEVDEDIM